MLKYIDVISRCREVHGNKYDYSKVKFKKVTDKVTIICPEHGEFVQELRQHYRGNGCPVCGGLKSGRKYSTTGDFIQKAKKKFGDEYDYSKVDYKSSAKKVEIICKKHGSFYIRPYSHLGGCGCPICGIEKRTKEADEKIESFKKRASLRFKNKYDYSNVFFEDRNEKVEIICPIHGPFMQSPVAHLVGNGCPKCSKEMLRLKKIGKSNTMFKEGEVAEYIASLIGEDSIELNSDVLQNGEKLAVYIPSLKIAFEVEGLETDSEVNRKNYRCHLDKTEECEKAGIHLIHIFEDEWSTKKDICKSRIKNLLGLSDKVFARKCKVMEVPKEDSSKFFNQNHIQGNIGCVVTYGLYYNDELVSAMSFGRLRKNMGRKNIGGEYEMTRFCNKGGMNVIGGASKLLKAFIDNYTPKSIISYADRRWSNGNLYEKLGFTFIRETKPSYFYVVNNKRKNRFSLRKNVLIEKYGCSPNDTEHNFCYNKGWYRIYDCGCKLYEYKKTAD